MVRPAWASAAVTVAFTVYTAVPAVYEVAVLLPPGVTRIVTTEVGSITWTLKLGPV
jgi:hypothetical protein